MGHKPMDIFRGLLLWSVILPVGLPLLAIACIWRLLAVCWVRLKYPAEIIPEGMHYYDVIADGVVISYALHTSQGMLDLDEVRDIFMY